jgi:hypothetical protein
MDQHPKIVVIGSANIDLIMRTKSIPHIGQIFTDGRFATACGGKGANQAVALARLGADVEFIGRIGQDPFGDTQYGSAFRIPIMTKSSHGLSLSIHLGIFCVTPQKLPQRSLRQPW